MNGAYLHLVTNHVPVIGFPIVFLLLTAGAIRKSRDLVNAGLVGLVLLGIVTTVAWRSGGPAWCSALVMVTVLRHRLVRAYEPPVHGAP